MRSSIILAVAAAAGLSSAAAIPDSQPALEARQRSCEGGKVGAFAYYNEPYRPFGSQRVSLGCKLFYCDGNTGQLSLVVECHGRADMCQLTPQGQGQCAP
jgi:hypothetical protein